MYFTSVELSLIAWPSFSIIEESTGFVSSLMAAFISPRRLVWSFCKWIISSYTNHLCIATQQDNISLNEFSKRKKNGGNFIKWNEMKTPNHENLLTSEKYCASTLQVSITHQNIIPLFVVNKRQGKWWSWQSKAIRHGY